MTDDQSLGKQVAKPYFVALVKEQAAIREEVGEISGEFGGRLKAAQDNSNLHLKAFRTVCQMNRMEEQKRNAFRDCLMLYLDFADEELWGGRHVGDLDKMARAAAAEDEDVGEGEPQAVDDAMAESVKNAEGIRELPPEQHEENQKPKRRGRAKAAVAEGLTDEEHEALHERGRIAFLDGAPGIIPDDLQGAPKKGERYLEGWSSAQVERSKAHDEADLEENPPRAEALPGADAPGSYSLTH